MARKLEKCNYQVDISFWESYYLFMKPFSEKATAERCFEKMMPIFLRTETMSELRLWDCTVSPAKMIKKEMKS